MTEKNSKKYKVLHVTWSGSKAGGLRDIVLEQLKDKDISLDVVFASDTDGIYSQDIRNNGIMVYSLGMKRKYAPIQNLSGAIILAKIIRNGDYDIVHYQEAILPFVFLAGKLADNRVKLLLHNRGEFIPFYESKLKKILSLLKQIFYKILISRYADLIITNSRFTYNDTLRVGVPEPKIRMLYNATDINRLKNISHRRCALRKKLCDELAINEGSYIIGTAARLVSWKRINFLIEAFSCLQKTDKKLIIMGDGEKINDLKDLSSKLGVDQFVHFLGFRKDAKEILAVLDAVVLPSKGEAFGFTALESVIMQVPVFVMKDGGGLTEFVKNEENGFICDDLRSLSEKLNKYANSELILEKQKNYDTFCSQFQIENYMESIKQFYFFLCEKK